MSYVGSASQPPGHSFRAALYPATVQQLLRAEQPHSDAKFSVDGIKVDMVTCVAGIVQIREYDGTGKRFYFVEDGSVGRLCVSWSLGAQIDPQLEGSFEENMYIRVMGWLKVFNGTRNELKATHIRPVLDMHEPFFHYLEAMVVFTSNQHISSTSPARRAPQEVSQPPQSTDIPVQQRAIQMDEGAEHHAAVQQTRLDPNTTLEEMDRLTLVDHDPDEGIIEILSDYQSSESGSLSSRPPSRPLSLSSTDPLLETYNRPSLLQDPYSLLSPLQRDILIQVQENTPFFPDGVPIQAMYRRVGLSTARELEIRQAIEDMMDDGLLYSTDQGHFKMVD